MLTHGGGFLSDPGLLPFVVPERLGNGSTESLIHQHIVGGVSFIKESLEPNERRGLFMLWFYATFFSSIFPTRPILAMIGPKGSGKSSAISRILELLFGPKGKVTTLPTKAEDFDATVTNSALVGYDNADSKCDWLPDRLAVVATGGVVKKRRLFTTIDVGEFPIISWLALTSRTPGFTRDDINDRLLVMRCDRMTGIKSEAELRTKLMSDRDALMGEVVLHLWEIVCALNGQRDVSYNGPFRMADFANFMTKLAVEFGLRPQIDATLEKLSAEQSDLTLSDDPVASLVMIWVESFKGKSRDATYKELCEQLVPLASFHSVQFEYVGKPHKFGQKMRNIRTNLEARLTIEPAGERHGGEKVYRFALKGSDYKMEF